MEAVFVEKYNHEVVRARCCHCVHYIYDFDGSCNRHYQPFGRCDLNGCNLFGSTFVCDSFENKPYFKLFDTHQLKLF